MNQLLNLTTMALLPKAVVRPKYDFASRTASIVHIGIGAFHKAHQATFTEDMMAQTDGNYRIIAVSLRSAGMRDSLKAQDYLYTAIERSNKTEQARVIGALQEVLVAPEDPQSVVNVLSNDAITVVTATITEKGYCLLPGNTGLDLAHTDIQHDLNNPNTPKTMVGFIVRACQVRQQKNGKGFTFISCDNLPDNSKMAGKAILEFAQKINADLARWIKSNVSFSNSMVDRIVPAVTPNDIESYTLNNGVIDNALVTSEPFRQWVIEDNFNGDRPPWDLAGALFVKDVSQYERLKLRYLNGSHSALAYLGKITGHQFIHQAIANPTLRRLVGALMADMKRTLSSSMDFNFDDYGNVIIDRFLNDEIQYQTQQVATDGSQKLPQRIMAPMQELLADDYLSKPMCLVLAGWVRYLSGISELGETHAVSDPMVQQLQGICGDKTLTPIQKIYQLMEIDGLFPAAIKNNTTAIDQISEYVIKMSDDGVISTIDTVFS
ncbi:mannitol dehydrogenase family protein [Psychrosphaera sp. 1_MG-2023]|uniref:mannitol dehydrogenase family protein n=1 Tax=Psychrosphaera sp. 1_MG-2023 TaxID=3062643 RepID=UPI0026E3C808|nr:mannitol dehydrogenase family protein [Psychrosphaera sp. 1_MG-2023]MDO6719142.1 mannitol dehydrogenase family protein [Psychrosphaera sp. 1_MG-2023]